jgi:S-adenosylmethionine:tRNA ribosyltransferase-isomerase
MRTSDFDYFLPAERIAQVPVEPRHSSRLLVYSRQTKSIEHSVFWHLERHLQPGDLLVVNQTRVIPARIHALKPTGGRVEILLLKKLDDLTWETMVGGKRIKNGIVLKLEEGPEAEIIEHLEGSRRVIRFSETLEPYLERKGEMPLPPYIHSHLEDPDRYQTVYARVSGSAAAPTAGLHFTPELMSSMLQKGFDFAEVTLHVGLDTFAPVTEEDPQTHAIHTEWCEVNLKAAGKINAAKKSGGRIVAVGTTTVRTLESAARVAKEGDVVGEFSGPTNLFILPGFDFKAVEAMITNFHLPKSTLLMLVSAFAGSEEMLRVYQEAIQEKYRFYSFGDAMLIL